MSLDPQQYATQWLNSVFKPDVENKVELVSGLNTETDTAVAGSLQTVAGQMDTAAGTGGAQDGGAQDGGAQDGGAQDGGAQAGETQGDETETGGSGGTSDMGKAGEWRPGDIANVLDSVSKITGSIPDLITAIGTLDDDVDDIVKAGGEAIKSGAEGIATVLDSTNKMDDQTVSSAAAPESSTDGGTKAGETQGDGAQAAQAGDTQAGDTQAGGTQAGGAQAGETQAGETQAGGAQPGGSQIGETTVGGIHSVGNVVSSGSPAATVPASVSQPLYSSLAGFPPIRAFSDSEQEHRRAPGLTPPPTTMPNDEQESPQ
ncbi:hypothetical protein ACIGO9_07135 [Nocardia asteroides]|uniref:hypothetical protein n=1 Tax=Nocardia asteroides TaxID=1824 RepID=UPI0037C85955